MRFRIIEAHEVDIPDDEYYAMEEPFEEIKDNAPWYIKMYGRREGCKEVEKHVEPC